MIPKDPTSFRERRLFSRDAKGLKAIRFREAGEDFTLELDSEEGWRLTESPDLGTDQRAVSRFIGVLKNLRGEDFPADSNRDAYGLDTPRLDIEFSFEDGTSTAIRVGRAVEGTENPEDGLSTQYYAQREDGVVTTVARYTLDGLRRKEFDFRTKTVFDFNPAQALEISLRFEGERYEFHKAAGRWLLDSPAGRRLESQSDA
ncbi:DUF4340 domain-containing protein, partial [Patescibacteria group bacterium]|nr:DUF4340 domain-containing protein [Patescibacteria group bacterium]